MNEGLQTSKQDELNKTAQWISEGSVWTIKSIDNHYINSAKYQPLKGSLHCQLPKKLRNWLILRMMIMNVLDGATLAI